jgi:ethanolamine utilization protein EutA
MRPGPGGGFGDGPGDGFVEGVDGVESFDVLSQGLDIGSSTSHLAVSRLVFRRQGSRLSARFEVARREVRYRSRIVLTPYSTAAEIDVGALAATVAGFLADAGIDPGEIGTGLVVITGEALKKRNAAAISRWLADLLGDFTCVSAGAHHEAVLAAHGSGAAELSRSTGTRGLCVDIGGGTTKLAVVEAGTVTSTFAFGVGGRLLAFDEQGVVVRRESSADPILAAAGVAAVLGARLGRDQRRRVAEVMAEAVGGFVTGDIEPGLAAELAVTEPATLPRVRDLDWLVFSGGVSEYVYGPSPDDPVKGAADGPGMGAGGGATDDLGRDLGACVRAAFTARGLWPMVREPVERIRATVVGAGEYSLQVSGMTGYVSDPGALPSSGLEVIKATASSGSLPRLGADLRAALRRRDRGAYDGGVAIAIGFDGRFRYAELRAVAQTVIALAGDGGGHPPITVVVEDDVARSLGALIAEELGWPGPVTILDGITVGELDYMDIGRPVGAVGSIPVTVTSLLFPSPAGPEVFAWPATAGTNDAKRCEGDRDDTL